MNDAELVSIDAALRLAGELRPHYTHVTKQFYPVRQLGCKGIFGDRFLRLYFDSEEIEDWELSWAASQIIVPVEHYLRKHRSRQGDRNQLCWDVGSLLSVVGDLMGEGLKFHPNTLHPDVFKYPWHLTAEEYCDRLYRQCSGRLRELEELAGQEMPEFGSAGGLATAEFELPEDAPVPTIDWMAALMAMQQHQMEESIPGTHAGNEIRVVKDNRCSAVDWRLELRGIHGTVITTSPGMADYSYLMPDPDFAVHPGQRHPGMVGRRAQTAVVVDTSASMGEGRIAQAKAEVLRILRESDSGISFFSCDAAASRGREVQHSQQLQFEGGGGTDMGVGINAAARHTPRPDVIVVITDGDTSWPEKGPLGIKVIIVLVGSGKTPAWAHKVIKVPMK